MRGFGVILIAVGTHKYVVRIRPQETLLNGGYGKSELRQLVGFVVSLRWIFEFAYFEEEFRSRDCIRSGFAGPDSSVCTADWAAGCAAGGLATCCFGVVSSLAGTRLDAVATVGAVVETEGVVGFNEVGVLATVAAGLGVGLLTLLGGAGGGVGNGSTVSAFAC